MFEHTETAESTCEGVLEPFNKKPTGAGANRVGIRRKMRG